MLVTEAMDGVFEVLKRSEDAALEASPCQFGKEPSTVLMAFRNPDAGEKGEGAGLVECKPARWSTAVGLWLGLGEAGEGHDAGALDLKPVAPVRRLGVADVGDRDRFSCLQVPGSATACPSAP